LPGDNRAGHALGSGIQLGISQKFVFRLDGEPVRESADDLFEAGGDRSLHFFLRKLAEGAGRMKALRPKGILGMAGFHDQGDCAKTHISGGGVMPVARSRLFD
jgi:hypothetical protein